MNMSGVKVVDVSSAPAQFQLEAVDGRVRWFHRNENKTTVFSIVTDGPVITRKKWVHVACTYNGLTGDAKIYIDGALAKQEIADPGVFLSLDWTGYAGWLKWKMQQLYVRKYNKHTHTHTHTHTHNHKHLCLSCKVLLY